MAIRTTNFVPGEYYHIYNRGNSKQRIFHDNADHHRFLKLLYLANSDTNLAVRNFNKDIYEIERGNRLVSIGAYCLMPNHFHLLLTPKDEGGLTKFMQKLGTSYSMYYNNRYERTGTLFEGRFKSGHVGTDRYLKYLFSYIHLNPLKVLNPTWKEGAMNNSYIEYLNKFKFSSYQEYAGNDRPDKAILSSEDFPKYFPNKKVFYSEISDWVNLA
ncbi:MAG: transposase [Parcubacteria group bacterium]